MHHDDARREHTQYDEESESSSADAAADVHAHAEVSTSVADTAAANATANNSAVHVVRGSTESEANVAVDQEIRSAHQERHLFAAAEGLLLVDVVRNHDADVNVVSPSGRSRGPDVSSAPARNSSAVEANDLLKSEANADANALSAAQDSDSSANEETVFTVSDVQGSTAEDVDLASELSSRGLDAESASARDRQYAANHLNCERLDANGYARRCVVACPARGAVAAERRYSYAEDAESADAAELRDANVDSRLLAQGPDVDADEGAETERNCDWLKANSDVCAHDVRKELVVAWSVEDGSVSKCAERLVAQEDAAVA